MSKYVGFSGRFHSFYRKGDKDECWIWKGAISGTGSHKKSRIKYGVIRLGKKMILAHRASYSIHIGDVPSGMCICHTCDNGLCVNPAHLFLGTSLVNKRDAVAKDRHARGERQAMAKLTDEKVKVIRARHIPYSRGGSSTSFLAREFGVSVSVIKKVVARDNWKHVE